MNEKISATFIVPDDFVEMSAHAIRLCELFVAKILDAAVPNVDIKVDEKGPVVISNDRSIKELISMYLKSGKLASFYQQLVVLARNDDMSGQPVLQIVLHGKRYAISLQELNGLPNLNLRVNKFEVAEFKN